MAETILNIDDSVSKGASDSELEFQTFNFSEGSSSAKEQYRPVPLTAPAQWEASPEPQAPASHPVYSVEYYQKYFNVDTAQVRQRILRSGMFWKGDFFEFLEGNPDLYGPFWIATTVIFVLFAAGNLSSSVIASMNGTSYTADFKMLTVATSSIYTYVFLISFALWGIMKYYQVPVSLLEVICLYGYGMSIFVPISIICVVPIGAVKWIFSFLAFVFSGFFMAHNLWKVAANRHRGLSTIISLGALLGHLALTLLFKFLFFTYQNIDP